MPDQPETTIDDTIENPARAAEIITRPRPLSGQIQDIIDWISGIDLKPKPDYADFAPGALRAAWSAINYLAWLGDEGTYRTLCLAALKPVLLGYPTGAALYQRITAGHHSNIERPFPSLEEIADNLPPISWAWPSWLPIGMLTLLAARPGTGKSLVALDLAHRIIAGQPWPDGAAMTRPGAAVIYIDGENVPQILNERAARWQMDRRNIYLLLPDEDDIILDLSQPRYQDKLSEMAYRLKPGLIVVDSLGSIMAAGENAIEDVRQILGYLAHLGAENAAGVLLIHHLRKASSGQLSLLDTVDPDMIRGSGHITAMARVVWGLSAIQTGPKPDPNGPRKLAVIKSNLSRYPDPLGITLEPLPDGDAVKLVYALNAPEHYQEPTERETAADWLIAYLSEAGEPVKPAVVIAAAAEVGYSRATIYRARETVDDQIQNTAGRKHPDNRWTLRSE